MICNTRDVEYVGNPCDAGLLIGCPSITYVTGYVRLL